jgi:hypothetical protein
MSLTATQIETVVEITETKPMTIFVVEESYPDDVKRYDNVIALEREGHRVTLTIQKKRGTSLVYLSNIKSIESN